jgi:hypothetical protein
VDGIRWADLAEARRLGDLPNLMRADRLAPIVATMTDLGRARAVLGTGQTLHLLPLIDVARALARVSEALGARAVSRFEILGKPQLFRALLLVSNTAAELMVGLAGLAASFGAALANLIKTAAFRGFRRRSTSVLRRFVR